jgi:protoheme IX farnesyltransferase
MSFWKTTLSGGPGTDFVERSSTLAPGAIDVGAFETPVVPDTVTTPTGSTGASAISRVADVLQLLKPRVNLLVLVTTFVGYRLAEASLQIGVLGRIPLPGAELLLHLLGATFLLGAGASALNQYLERDLDAKMERTRSRPVASGRMSASFARGLGVVLNVVGIVWLAFFVNPYCAAVGAVTSALYVFAYTPLKTRTTMSLIVGAVPGALPPLIGWAAVTGSLGGAAWSLFTVQFIWQIPHFLAIAWLYREDYRRAGFRLLTVVDEAGFTTSIQVVAWSLALLPASLAIPALFRLGGVTYFYVALAIGLVFLVAAVVFALRRSRRTARILVIVSVLYLPILFLTLVANL